MRIWDIDPGYLNRQSLLGEHRELHGIVSILINHKKGYSSHPETLRWVGLGWALRMRHEILAAEMRLRGYTDRSPVNIKENKGKWPLKYVDEPYKQFTILREKYKKKEKGRIPLPIDSQKLWSHHKYSVLARDTVLYKVIGKKVSKDNSEGYFRELSLLLTETLRIAPKKGGILNSLQHMWGHISEYSGFSGREVDSWNLDRLFSEIQHVALKTGEIYLINSTALSELSVWIKDYEG